MKKKSSFVTVILIAAFFIGALLLLYPTISDFWNSFHQSRAIASYAEQVADLDENAYDRLWEDARIYNKTLGDRMNRFVMAEEQKKAYAALLNIADNGVMGYIEIPKVRCNLPIYHGTDEAVLQVAIGHVPGSSLPVGGASTHCVLSGHRGLPSAKLFTNLDELETGDVFMLRVLDETLTYEVDQIRTVLPNELGDLAIVEGEDYCTLVTCTPYGINSHRLLVRGHRVENHAGASTIRVTADAMQIEPLQVAPLVAAPILVVMLVVVLIPHRTKGKGDEG
ncbi:MAG: class C sortase [Clostridiales bacterium]|nr:class C sortase [Clostridiales bacterium]